MLVDDTEYKSAKDFLYKMDCGLFDGEFVQELRRLSREQLEDIAAILIQRASHGEKAE